jgi:hypothetical protein
MGSFAIAIVVALVGYLLWRELRRQALSRPAGTNSAKRQATTLERDPATGVYRTVERTKPPVSNP